MPDDLFKKLPKFGKINFGPLKYTSAKKGPYEAQDVVKMRGKA